MKNQVPYPPLSLNAFSVRIGGRDLPAGREVTIFLKNDAAPHAFGALIGLFKLAVGAFHPGPPCGLAFTVFMPNGTFRRSRLSIREIQRAEGRFVVDLLGKKGLT
jgi:hypothetical protein